VGQGKGTAGIGDDEGATGMGFRTSSGKYRTSWLVACGQYWQVGYVDLVEDGK
jgi:hypothetical protein